MLSNNDTRSRRTALRATKQHKTCTSSLVRTAPCVAPYRSRVTTRGYNFVRTSTAMFLSSLRAHLTAARLNVVSRCSSPHLLLFHNARLSLVIIARDSFIMILYPLIVDVIVISCVFVRRESRHGNARSTHRRASWQRRPRSATSTCLVAFSSCRR